MSKSIACRLGIIHLLFLLPGSPPKSTQTYSFNKHTCCRPARRVPNAETPDLMKIKIFILLYKLLDADEEELTRTGKVRRRFVYGLYIKIIEAMYRGEKNVRVQGKVRYRDGRIGEIETTVNIIKTD